MTCSSRSLLVVFSSSTCAARPCCLSTFTFINDHIIHSSTFTIIFLFGASDCVRGAVMGTADNTPRVRGALRLPATEQASPAMQ